MSKKLNVLVSFICTDNSGDEGDTCFWFKSAFNGYDETDAQDIVIDNPDGHRYDMIDKYHEYEEVLFRAVIASQIRVGDDETYIIIKKSRNTFLVKYYVEYEECDYEDIDEDDIFYINNKPYIDTDYREAYWFTDLRFTDRDTTEPKEVEGKIWEAFEKYEEEYFEEYDI